MPARANRAIIGYTRGGNMLDRRTLIALSVPGLMLVAAFVATADDAVMLFRAGVRYALIGNFLAVAGSLVMVLAGGFLAVATFVLLPFILLLRGESAIATAIAEWLETRGLDGSRMSAAWLGNAPGTSRTKPGTRYSATSWSGARADATTSAR